jgi:hypothetical protein
MLLTLQAVILLFCLPFVFFYPYPRHLRKIEGWLAALGRRKRSVIFLAPLIPLFICGEVTSRLGVPQPAIHDEFSYLLASDTFAHGRLTNPTHPLWKHFETYHVIFQPTYQSKYPPAQGLFLALGQVLTDYPIVGVWISLALAMSAMVWMLQAFVPPRWALIASLFALSSFPILRQWGLSYWGGAVAMLGGALFLGGLRRWLLRPKVYAGIASAAGVSLLANSRPYEGLLFTVFATILFALPRADRLKARALASSWRKALPAVAVLVANFLWMGYYNYRVTGDPLTMPYQVWAKQVLGTGVATSTFDFASKPASANLSRILIPSGADGRLPQVTGLTDTRDVIHKLYKLGNAVGLLIGVAVLAAMISGKNRSVWKALLLLSLLTLAVVIQNTTGNLHYLAPATCVLMLLVAKGLQRISIMRFGFLDGRSLNLALLAACLLMVILFFFAGRADTWSEERFTILQQLRATGKRHLVIAQYSASHQFFQEWVYNEANIDAAQVIWARDLGPERNKELIQYYPDRTIWELDADASPPTLTAIRRPE